MTDAKAAEAHAAHERAISSASAPLPAMSAGLLKAVALVDGGAAFATVLLLCASLREMRELAFRLVAPLALFGFGMTVAAFGLGFVYLAQSRRAAALAAQERVATPPFLQETAVSREADAETRRFLRFGAAAVAVAMASAVLGFLLSGAILLVSLR